LSQVIKMFKFMRKFPLAGMNWGEFFQAYRTFLAKPDDGILHIMAAQRYSNWDAWSKKRLLSQSKHLVGRPLKINVDELLTLPADTLGGSYARHLKALGFDPNAFVDAFDDEDWFDQRTGVSHDLYHIVTGFDAGPLGEFGLAAFALVQYRDLLNAFVLSFVPLSLTNPVWTFPLVRNIWRGFRMGWRCKPIIGYEFELNWATPLSQVRRDLGITALFPQAA
ncbi:MAG: Coq4 family protein, partial [Cyanobacteria bacterium P01_F01_bin.42]